MLARLNPYRGLPNKLEVWAWSMYDLANQSFTLIINTLLFAVFFSEVVSPTPARGDYLWGAVVAASLLLVVVASPVAGALADHLAIKKQMLVWLGLACVAFTCALGLIPRGALWLAAAIYIPANFTYAMGENFLAAFLPEIARSKDMGRVSAIGWTMGYVGALILLGVTSGAMALFGLKHPDQWRPLFVFAGLWFLAWMVPTMLLLKERSPTRPPPRARSLLTIGFVRLGQTVRDAERYRQLMRFLAIFFVYSMGVQTVIFFASIIAHSFGFIGPRLVLFLLPVTVMAGVGAMGAGVLQDRVGHRRTVLLALAVWTFTAVALVLMPQPRPGQPPRGEWMLWVVANGMGLGLGAIGTSSRALVGVFTPRHKTAEFFGLWGLSYKLAGVVGVFGFGMVKSWLGDRPAYMLLAAIFVVGLGLMLLVDEREGLRAAREAEREADGQADSADDAAAVGATAPLASVMGAGVPAPGVDRAGDDSPT